MKKKSQENDNELSEQKKMDSLIAELAGTSSNKNDKDLKESLKDKTQANQKSENIKLSAVDENSNTENKDIISETESDDFSYLDDDEIEFFDTNKDDEINKKDAIDTPLRNKKFETKTIKKKQTFSKKALSIKKIILLSLLLIIFFSIWFIYKHKNENNSLPISKYQSPDKQPVYTNKPLPAEIINKSESSEIKRADSNRLEIDNNLKKIELLIDKLKKTKNELDILIQFYNDGIKNVELNINKEKKEKNITTFKDAIKNMRIKLDLETIQRRLFYIYKLEKPLNQLNYDIEELIFLNRKIKIAMQIIPIINKTEIVKINNDIKTVLLKHISITDTLFPDNISTNNLESLENIWAKLPKYIKKKTNQAIWEEICNGKFNNLNKITELSIDAAECLSLWDGKDLYLNKISMLTPQTTKKLIAWKGEWLCLNALKDLSSDTAKYLFKWKGKHISLNNITEISDKEAEYIYNWNGKQLEMINLNKFSPKAAQYLTKWINSGGTLYINDRYQKKYSKK